MSLAKTVLVVGKAQQELQNLYATEHGLKLIREVIDETVEARERMAAGSVPTQAHARGSRGATARGRERPDQLHERANLTVVPVRPGPCRRAGTRSGP